MTKNSEAISSAGNCKLVESGYSYRDIAVLYRVNAQ